MRANHAGKTSQVVFGIEKVNLLYPGSYGAGEDAWNLSGILQSQNLSHQTWDSFSQALEIWQGVTLSVPEIAKSADGEKRGATIGVVKGEIYRYHLEKDESFQTAHEPSRHESAAGYCPVDANIALAHLSTSAFHWAVVG